MKLNKMLGLSEEIISGLIGLFGRKVSGYINNPSDSEKMLDRLNEVNLPRKINNAQNRLTDSRGVYLYQIFGGTLDTEINGLKVTLISESLVIYARDVSQWREAIATLTEYKYECGEACAGKMTVACLYGDVAPELKEKIRSIAKASSISDVWFMKSMQLIG